jgi:hypothetical protein
MYKFLAIIGLSFFVMGFNVCDISTPSGSDEEGCMTAEDCSTASCDFPSCNLKTGTCECE